MWNLVHTDAEKKATTDKRHLLSTEQEMAWDTGIARTRDSGNSIHFLRQFSSYAQVIIQNLSVTHLIISWRVDKNRQLRNQGMPETEDKHFFQLTDLLFTNKFLSEGTFLYSVYSLFRSKNKLYCISWTIFQKFFY